MIELNNLSKTYTSKKGNDVKALNNITLKFDDTGMTFILGKSGSGKSTLLNILGGLDRYDSGDMSILGKSTKTFNNADFDSYRNTYVGFIFQEYNLLEDYDVYENIILALQLQQREKQKDKIEQLLEKLELSELRHRKVNELSGGQKQRVAIARALIKDPKIILADEPTGNLDSMTGRQVMDLLKEISKDRLVIIVSHDNEFATTYGDRIIEIKDGIIVNDIRKNLLANNLEQNYKTLKSKLPLKESFKIGIGSLRHKKMKLCFTILLTIFSLLFLSIVDTLSSYNVNVAHSKLLKEKEENFVQIEKYHLYSEDDFVYKDILDLKKEDIENIQNRLAKKSSLIYRIRNEYRYDNIYSAFHINSEYDGYSYDYGSLELEIVEDSSFEYIKSLNLIGRLPESTNEIIISNVIANLIIAKGIIPYGEEELYFPKNYEELVNSKKSFLFGSEGKIEIVGIINNDLSKYTNIMEKIKDPNTDLTSEERKIYTDYSAKLNNIYNKIFVQEGFTKDLNIENNLPLSSNCFFQLSSPEIKIWQEGRYISPSLIHNEIEYYNGTDWISTNKLKENEVILNVNQLEEFNSSDYREKLSLYINQNLGKEQLELEKEFFIDYIKKFDIIGKKVTLKVTESTNEKNNHTYDNLTVVGITGLITNNEKYYYVPTQLMSEYEVDLFPTTGVFIVENNQKELKNLMDEFPYNEEISLKSTYSFDVNSMIRTITTLKKISSYIAIVLVIFTVTLLSNFMFSSISYRKQEIGILRGLGARSIDIVKIFLWEGIVLATISFILSSIVLVIVTNLLNDVILAGTDLFLTPFIIGIRQFMVMLLIVYLIIFISSLIPIIKCSKMKPINAILKK